MSLAIRIRDAFGVPLDYWRAPVPDHPDTVPPKPAVSTEEPAA